MSCNNSSTSFESSEYSSYFEIAKLNLSNVVKSLQSKPNNFSTLLLFLLKNTANHTLIRHWKDHQWFQFLRSWILFVMYLSIRRTQWHRVSHGMDLLTDKLLAATNFWNGKFNYLCSLGMALKVAATQSYCICKSSLMHSALFALNFVVEMKCVACK